MVVNKGLAIVREKGRAAFTYSEKPQVTFRRSDGYFGPDTRVCCIYKTIVANGLPQVSNAGGCVCAGRVAVFTLGIVLEFSRPAKITSENDEM